MSLHFDHAYRDRGLHNFEENLNQPRHRWYPFKEGFSNQLVREAIANAGPNSKRNLKVLDPFGGSGTTPLTAALLGHEAVAIEVNPFCAFTARVKCLPGQWREKHFRRTVEKVLTEAGRSEIRSPLEGLSTFTEGGDSPKWLFNREVIRFYTGVTRAIARYGVSYAAALRLAAIRAAMDCCNAKKDGKCLRYYSDWKERAFAKEDFRQAFADTAETMLRDTELAKLTRERKVLIHCADARRVVERLPDRSFDLVVTSPPYLNSLDYSDVYRPELFLGRFVRNNEELRSIRLRTLRSHLQVNWGGETEISHTRVRVVVKALQTKANLWNNKIPVMVEAYFYDMQKLLCQLSRLLRLGAEAWIVVSTSAYKGVHIPVDLILADLATEAKFKLSGVYVLRALRAAGQQQGTFGSNGLPLRESLIILHK